VYLLDGQREVMFSNQNAFLLGKFDSNMWIDFPVKWTNILDRYYNDTFEVYLLSDQFVTK
jgi:hypothetical protein